MGKLSKLSLLIRILKIFFCYFYFFPIFPAMLFGYIVDFILGVFQVEDETRLFIALLVQIPIAFVVSCMYAMREGYRDSFYGRYSFRLYLLANVGSMIVYIAADRLTELNVCPISSVFIKLGLSNELFSTLFFIAMCALVLLCYFIGRMNALNENAEAVYKTENSVAKEKAAKSETQALTEKKKTGTWRDSVRGDD
jgi:hypothetical protein